MIEHNTSHTPSGGSKMISLALDYRLSPNEWKLCFQIQMISLVKAQNIAVTTDIRDFVKSLAEKNVASLGFFSPEEVADDIFLKHFDSEATTPSVTYRMF